MPASLENSATAIGLEKVSFQRRAVAKNSNCYKIVLISHTSKAILKTLQARLQQYVNKDSQKFKLDSEKAVEPEIRLPKSVGSSKKQESPRKTTTFALLTMPKSFSL